MSYHLLQRREDKAQIFYQPDKCFTLRFRSCVGRPTVLVQSANVADTDRPMIPSRAMRSVEGNIPSRFNRAVETAAVKSCPARVAEQWMMMVSLIVKSSFLVCV